MDSELRQLLEAEARRQAVAPFGPFERAQRQREQEASHARRHAAEALLERALAAWDEDHERALEFVRRAVRLPFDPHEESWPAGLAGGMLIFNAVIDELEDCPEDDDTWLAAAEMVLADPLATGRSELRHVLSVVVNDYNIEDDERRRAQKAIAEIPELPDLRNLGPDDSEDLQKRVVDTITCYLAYQRALAEIEDAG